MTSPQLGGNLDINSNNITGTGDINITGDISATTVSIAGTLTYEDVTNVDSVGLITARAGIVVTGVCTATSFSGSGASLTSVDADTLDGVQGSNFLRSDIDDSTSGYLVANGFVGSGGALRIANPGGASFATTTATSTGYLKITLPVSWTSTMMRMTIRCHEYNPGESFDIHCGGFNYATTSTWNRTFAYIVGGNTTDRNFTVRFGHDGSKCAIYIGESNSTWTYFQFGVTEFLAGYSNYTADSWHSGWSCSITTSLGTISGNTFTTTQLNKYIDGNVSWHAGNDGSGSGLDADTLDGLNSTSFLRSDQSDNLTSGNLTLDSGNIAVNNGTNKQIYLNAGDGAIEITRSSGGAYIDFKNSTSEDYDARIQEASNTLYLNGNRILTTADEGSGNGLDADTVDGVQLSGLVRSQTGSVLGSMLTLGSQSSNYRWNNSTNGRPADAQTNEFGTLLHLDYDGSKASQFAWDIAEENLYLRTLTYSTDTGSTWKKVWTDGNDGSGSGLDADTLDGQQGSAYLRNDLTSQDVQSNLAINDSGNFSVLRYKDSNQVDRNHFYHANSGGYAGLGVFDTSGANRKDLLLYQNGSITWNSNTVWHAGNDGSGSGLDADTVDGLQGTKVYEASSTIQSNLDTYYTSSVFSYSTSTTGRPSSYGMGLAFVSNAKTYNTTNNWITQLAFSTSGGEGPYFRTRVNALDHGVDGQKFGMQVTTVQVLDLTLILLTVFRVQVS